MCTYFFFFHGSWLQVPCRRIPWRIWGRNATGLDGGQEPWHASRRQTFCRGTHNCVTPHIFLLSLPFLTVCHFRFLFIMALHILGSVSYKTLKMLKQGGPFGVCMEKKNSILYLGKFRFLGVLFIGGIRTLWLIVFPGNDSKLLSRWMHWSRSFRMKTHSMRTFRNTWKEWGPNLDR